MREAGKRGGGESGSVWGEQTLLKEKGAKGSEEGGCVIA